MKLISSVFFELFERHGVLMVTWSQVYRVCLSLRPKKASNQCFNRKSSLSAIALRCGFSGAQRVCSYPLALSGQQGDTIICLAIGFRSIHTSRWRFVEPPLPYEHTNDR